MTKEKKEPLKKEIIITGFGGQGIVLAGRILGKAASLCDHKESTLIQSYGPEARGGACSADVIISSRPIYYPYIKSPDILACMSQSGFEKFIGSLKKGGQLLIDQDLVKPVDVAGDFFSIPATLMAEELGRTMMANIIMVGFITAITEVISLKASRDTVTGSVPKGTEEINLTAFSKGYNYGLALLKSRHKKAVGKTGA
ncbi:MAG: pyruvate ferredoxin oxidoreductase [Desulfobacteraceae bacterium 4484_190.1]|nr:MAG: pyruvate ferredoxin oxidoreductase [Desulfobacteraceae bacterium 4484_190.1]